MHWQLTLLHLRRHGRCPVAQPHVNQPALRHPTPATVPVGSSDARNSRVDRGWEEEHVRRERNSCQQPTEIDRLALVEDTSSGQG
eukprot:2495376-Rhodomonas_salina.3